MVGRHKDRFALSLLLVLVLLLTHLGTSAQGGRTAKVNNLYRSLVEYKIACPKTVLAIIIFETGWLECKNCSYQYNNLFGFRTKNDYIRFKSVYACLDYFKIWQETYYGPWKAKHPNGTYYQYLAHVKYAHVNIAHYIRTIKSVEKLVAENVRVIDASLIPQPGYVPNGQRDSTLVK